MKMHFFPRLSLLVAHLELVSDSRLRFKHLVCRVSFSKHSRVGFSRGSDRLCFHIHDHLGHTLQTALLLITVYSDDTLVSKTITQMIGSVGVVKVMARALS